MFLRVASVTKRTRSEANNVRVVAAIDAKGDDFLRGLERYRFGAGPITEDDQKLTALQNFFAFGHKIFQFSLLKNAALNSMVNEYLRIIPNINKINANSNRLILSKISKQDGYVFVEQVQDFLDELSLACERYCG